MSAEERWSGRRSCSARLEAARARLEATDDPERGDRDPRRARGAREGGRGGDRSGAKREAECGARLRSCGARRGLPRRARADAGAARAAESMRYALAGGGKRVRPVICLATGEAAGGEAEEALPAAAALELVHNFSLVHDDLPALDDDEERRGQPSTGRSARRSRSSPATRCSRRRCGSRSRTRRRRSRRELAAGDARDDRRPVPRHHGRERRSRDAAPAEDGLPLRGVGRAGLWAAGVPGARAGAVAGVRRRARAALPARRRHPRRRRLRARTARTERASLADEAAERAQARLAAIPTRTRPCWPRSSPASRRAPPSTAGEEAARRPPRRAGPRREPRPGAGARHGGPRSRATTRRGSRWTSRPSSRSSRRRASSPAAARSSRTRSSLRRRPAGRDCLDLGASTGGFTDVLLQAARTRVSRSTSATGSSIRGSVTTRGSPCSSGRTRAR